MFKIESVELFNWSYFAPFTNISFANSLNLILGENGSGKTSLINAIRIVLGGSTYSNDATSGRSHFKNYLVNGDHAVIKLLVTNRNKDGSSIFGHLRPEEWSDAVNISLFCVVHKQKTREYYVGKEDIPVNGFKDKARQYRTEGILSKRLNVEYYRDEIIAKIGLTRSFIDIISQEQGRVPDFIRMSDEQLFSAITEVIDISDTLEDFRVEKKKFLHAKKDEEKILLLLKERMLEKQRLEERIDNYKEYEKYLYNYKLNNDLYYPIVRELELVKEIDDYKQVIQSTKENNKKLEKQLTDIQKEEISLKNKLEDINVAFESFTNNFHLAKGKVEKLEEKKENIISELNNYNQLIEGLKKCEIIVDDNIGVGGEFVKHYETIENKLHTAKVEFHKLNNNVYEWEKEIELISDGVELKRYLPNKVKSVLNKLDKDFKQRNIKYTLIADTINVIDRTWQRAVEGHLGGRRFCIVVKEKDLLETKKNASTYRYNHKVMKEKKASFPINPKSLLSKIEVLTDEIDVSGHVVDMNSIICVSSVEEGHNLSKNNTRSITKDAYEQDADGSGVSKYIDDYNFCCGNKLTDEAINDQNEKANIIKRRIGEATKHSEVLEEKIHALKNVHKLIKTIIDNNITFDSINSQMSEKEKLNKEINKLKMNSESTVDNFNKTNKEREKINNSLSNITSESNRLNNKIKKNIQLIDEKNSKLSDLGIELSNLKKTIKEMDAGKQFEAETLVEKEGHPSEYYKKETERYLTLVEEYKAKHNASTEDKEKYPIDSTITLHYEKKINEIENLFDIHKKANELTIKRIEAYEVAKNVFYDTFDDLILRLNDTLLSFSEAIDIKYVIRKNIINDEKIGVEYNISFGDRPITTWKDRKLSGGEATISNILFFLALTNIDQIHKPNILILDEHTSNLDNKNMTLLENFFLSTDMQCIFSTPKSSEARIFEKIQHYIFLTPNRNGNYWPYPAYFTRETMLAIVNKHS